MAYSKKTWKDRISEFPNRRKLTESGVANVYDVTRNEGNVTEAGDPFNAETMNDMESRIESGFSEKFDKSGGSLTGNVSIEKNGQKASLFLVDAPNGAASLQSGSASASDTTAILYGFEVPEGLPPGTIVDNDNYTAVYLGRAATPNINALRLVRKISGSITTYSVYGTHNITVSQTAPSSALSNGAMHMVY